MQRRKQANNNNEIVDRTQQQQQGDGSRAQSPICDGNTTMFLYSLSEIDLDHFMNMPHRPFVDPDDDFND